MNTLLLLLGLRPWQATNSTSVLTRVAIAISLVSIELQVVTLARTGTLRTLVVVNLVVALLLSRRGVPTFGEPPVPVRVRDVVPLGGAIALAAAVAVLALSRPIVAADPYHLDKSTRIFSTGTLSYDPATVTKINILNSTYELVLADLQIVPVVGPWLLRLHGLFGLLLYLTAMAALREQVLRGTVQHPGATAPRWIWGTLLVIPVVFHQLILIKNDLLIAAFGSVVIAWTLTGARTARTADVIWAGWLAGLAMSLKLTALPVVVVVTLWVAAAGAGALAARLGALAAGGTLGALSGGFFFTLIENVRVYGAWMPIEGIGGGQENVAGSLIGIPRFVISLFDMGLVTRVWWPGRGGWGGTFGLPVIWAGLVLVLTARRDRLVRETLLASGIYFLLFAAAFADADLAHRIALGPGLLLTVVALTRLPAAADAQARLLRTGLAAALALSVGQIARSAVLYLQS